MPVSLRTVHLAVGHLDATVASPRDPFGPPVRDPADDLPRLGQAAPAGE